MRLLLILFVSIAVGTSLVGITVIEDAPTVEYTTAPTPENVRDARDFIRGVRASVNPQNQVQGPFETTEQQLNSVVKLGGRLIRGFRGEVSVSEEEITFRVSLPVPYTDEEKWINFLAIAPEFDKKFSLTSVRVGQASIPPELAIELIRIGANVYFGNALGDTVLQAATAMRLERNVVAFDLAIDELGKNGVMRGIFGALRRSEMPSAAEIERYYLLLREAMERGDLPSSGSYLPYLLFTLEAAHEGSAIEGVENAYTSAIFALTRICGASDFTLLVGSLSGGDLAEAEEWSADCGALTLNGRIDSRRHFTTAAAIQAASNRGFAITVGEYKELHDTLGSGGFDFTDIAANNSGIRLTNRFMRTPYESWPALLARIEVEGDVIMDFDGIPGLMPGEEFEATYGNVDSAKYRAMLNHIEDEIGGLRVHK